MSKGNIITLIIILIISVIVAVIALLVNDTEEEKNKYKTEYGIITLVDNSDTFFSVSANLNKFYTFLYENNNEKLYNILDKNYIIENNITTNNVNTLLSHNDNNVKVVVDKIYVVSKNEMYIYYVKGNLISNEMDAPSTYLEEVYFIVNYDALTKAFSIKPINKNKYDKNDNRNEYTFVKIIENSDNLFDNTYINERSMAEYYFYNFINNIFYNRKIAYNSLKESFKSKYYSSYDEFNNYVENNSEYLANLKINKYEKESNHKYTMIDSENNIYTFDISGVANYVVSIEYN